MDLKRGFNGLVAFFRGSCILSDIFQGLSPPSRSTMSIVMGDHWHSRVAAYAVRAFNFYMKYILGIKQGMTQFFDENGVVHPVTQVLAGPIMVTQIKTKAKDGYSALQFGFGKRNEKSISKAQRGHFSAVGGSAPGGEKTGNTVFAFARERKGDTEEAKKGDTISVDVFSPGDKVTVSGISKGKGFQGVVKRHGFAGGPRTHGQKHSERSPGSIGATGPQRVFKGKKMAGRMGADRVTVKNLIILAVDTENNELLVSGAVPGRRGTLLEIRSQQK